MKWNETMTVKNAKIDDQHKTLFQTLDNLLAACNAKKGHEEIGKTLDFLADYTVTHFRDEEAYLAANHYPQLAEHKAIHDRFIEEVNDIAKRYHEEGASLPIIIELNGKLNDWLITHIMNTDKQYCKHINGGTC